MTKADHIAYWQDTAAFDWPAVQRMMQAGDYVHGLFFAHLVIEKLSKAHWVKDNADNIPPKIHNIIKLWAATRLTPTAEHIAMATELNNYQLEGRYPEYMRQLYSGTTPANAQQLFTDVNILRTWLLSVPLLPK